MLAAILIGWCRNTDKTEKRMRCFARFPNMDLHAQPVAPWVRRVACWAVALTLLAGCANLAGPEYQRPQLPEKAQWSQLEGRDLTVSEVIRPDWWAGFGDPYLNDLIQRAVSDGLDLRVAALRLDKAGIQLRRDRFPATPQVTIAPTETITRQKSSGQSVQTQHDRELLGAGLTWELDIWGKIRKDLKAADARYHETEMDWRAAHLTLVTSVAQRYFEVRQFDEQIEQQRVSIRQEEQLLQIYEAQYAEGMVAETNIRSQRAEIHSLNTTLTDLERGRKESELKLATLIGVPAGKLSVPAGHLRDTVHQIPLPAVLPADTLSRRPDVLKAEYTVLEAHHLVGSARLARLPTFSLSAAAKTGASLASLINVWSVGLMASAATMFDRNAKIDVKLSEAQLAIDREDYRRVVLQAFEEVEIALVDFDAHQRQMKDLQAQIADLEVVRDVQKERLTEGLVSQLEVFDTERSLLSAQQTLLTTYEQVLIDTVTLYKAVGGGWPSETLTQR